MSVSGLVSVALFLLAATAVSGFSVTTSNKAVRVKEGEGADLTCSYSADFGANPRVEWKFQDTKGSMKYVFFDKKPTEPYAGRVTVYANSNLRFTKVTRKDNGVYDCEVSSGVTSQFGEVRVVLTVLVPPSPPMCRIPPSVTTGNKAELFCYDADGSPPSKYNWYRNNALMPTDPSTLAAFKNFTYTLNQEKGNLVFPAVKKSEAGEYFCEAFNDAGPPQRCKAQKMEVRDPNTGGIIAGIIVALLLLALLGFGIWYAHKKGYLPKKQESKPKTNVVYQPTSLYGGGEDEDGEFKQKSSFVV